MGLERILACVTKDARIDPSRSALFTQLYSCVNHAAIVHRVLRQMSAGATQAAKAQFNLGALRVILYWCCQSREQVRWNSVKHPPAPLRGTVQGYRHIVAGGSVCPNLALPLDEHIIVYA